METTIKKISKLVGGSNLVLVCTKRTNLNKYNLSKKEIKYINEQLENSKTLIEINNYSSVTYVVFSEEKMETYKVLESYRKSGGVIASKLNNAKITSVSIIDGTNNPENTLAVAEGIALANYQFIHYFRDAGKRTNSLNSISIVSPKVKVQDITELQEIVNAVYNARTLVNEPVSFLTATQLSKEIEKTGKNAGFKVEVFKKQKITSLKLGGLLAVNKGSLEPPTFNILEWKPENAKNTKPIILVGKGVVYDTGGLSLKTTKGSMDQMKCDMGGSAAVIGTMQVVAKMQLPLHVIGLIPATDNRPGGDAYAPGDVIKMHNGMTVEVLNTDAEGRIILADALSYAKKYNPELVIDLATLTGAAQRAVGNYASVIMGTTDKETNRSLTDSGFEVFERVVEFPFWDEYGEEIKSDIADIKNTGSINAGMITAGKFLEHFTKDDSGSNAYPWIHIDIAGPAFMEYNDSYRGKGGTGVGVRLLYNFLKKRAK